LDHPDREDPAVHLERMASQDTLVNLDNPELPLTKTRRFEDPLALQVHLANLELPAHQAVLALLDTLDLPAMTETPVAPAAPACQVVPALLDIPE